jgi:hypothetical protein
MRLKVFFLEIREDERVEVETEMTVLQRRLARNLDNGVRAFSHKRFSEKFLNEAAPG